MPTRLYFPATTPPPVSPAFLGGWNYTSEATRFFLANIKGTSPITVGTVIGPWTPGQVALDRQYVSTRMAGGIDFNGVTLNGQLMVREYASTDNVSAFFLRGYIISEDGSTLRNTIVSGGLGPEFTTNASHRNQQSLPATSGPYTTVLGDRIVIEMGYRDTSGTTPEASAKWGENAPDLPAGDSSQTTDGAGWVEFSNIITFVGEVASSVTPTDYRFTLLGVG